MLSSHWYYSLAVLLLVVLLGSTPAQKEIEPVYQGKPLSEWLKQLRSTKTEDRQRAATALWVSIGPEGKAAVAALIKALEDENEGVRNFAAHALGPIGKEAKLAVPALIKALRDPAARDSAVNALGSIGPDEASVPALIEALKDSATRASALAVLAEGGFGPAAKPAVPALVEAAKDEAPRIRVMAVVALGGIGAAAKPAAPVLIQALNDKDFTMRASAADALGGIGEEGKAAIPALIEILKGEKSSLRPNAARALGKIGPAAKAAFPALTDALKEKTRDERQAAAWALIRIDPKAAKQAGVPEPVTDHLAHLGNSAEYFDRDDDARASSSGAGGEAIHTLTLWVNGDPIGFYSTDEANLGSGLNQWLRPGKNELTFSGRHEKSVYVKISKWHGGGFVGLAGKRRFAGPGGEDRMKPLVFPVEQTLKLPEREELSNRPEDRQRDEKEVRALLTKLKDLVHAGKGQEAAVLLNDGRLLWAKTVYGMTQEEVRKEFFDPTTKVLSDPKLKAVNKERPLRLLFGKRSVLAYVEPPAKGEDNRHLFARTSKDGKQARVGPFHLARVGGKWVFWDVDVAW